MRKIEGVNKLDHCNWITPTKEFNGDIYLKRQGSTSDYSAIDVNWILLLAMGIIGYSQKFHPDPSQCLFDT